MPSLSPRTVSVNKAKCLLLALATSVIFTAGCGMGVMSTASSPDEPLAAATIHGKAMGGSTPIVGATVTLWETRPNGVAATGLAGGYYSGTAVALATVTSGTNGSFNFTTACQSSADEAYITFSGGNSGAGVSNPNILLMAAVGPCAALSSVPFVMVNEVSTVAAAYTLAGFTSISSSTSGGVTTNAVNVTASANNSATTPYYGSGGTGTIYHPVGLQHAFLNAQNLADVPAGIAFTYLPTQGPSGTAVMPAPLINSVANVLQACTNSAGATPEITFTGSSGTLTSSTLGTSDTLSGNLTLIADGTTYNLPSATTTWSNVSQATVLSAVQAIPGLSTSTFSGGVLTIIDTHASPSLAVGNTDAQYTGTGTASSLLDVPASSSANICSQVFAAALPLGSTTAPTNILQAALNIARNPYMGGAGKAATFLGLSAGTGANPYSPVITPANAGTLTAVPHDLSAAIYYPTANAGIYTPSALTLDANDNLYVANKVNGAVTPYFSYSLVSIASNGVPLLNHAYCPSPGAGAAPTYNQSTCAEIVGNVSSMKADASGSIWMTDVGAGTATATTTTYAGTQNELVQVSAATGAFQGPGSTSAQASVYPVVTAAAPEVVAIDQKNNAWVGDNTYCSSCVGFYNIYEYVYNSGTSQVGAAAGAGEATENVYALAIDANQNIWGAGEFTPGYVGLIPNQQATSTYNTTPGALATTPTYIAYSSTSTPTTNPVIAMSPSTSGNPYGAAIDGSGNEWQSSTKTSYYGLEVFQTTGATASSPATGISQIGTLITGAAATTTNGLINTAFAATTRYLSSDGDSAIWAGDYTNNQIIRTYGTGGTSILGYKPCVASGTSNYCATYSSTVGFQNPYYTVEDSTGAIWVGSVSAATASTGSLMQVFGVAAPTFPLLQAGHPGVMP